MESNLMLLLTELCTRPVNFVEGIISLMNTIRPPRSTAASHASTRWPGQSKRKQDTSGARKVERDSFVLDHKIPVSALSTREEVMDPTNLVVCCRECNIEKGNKYTYEEFKKMKETHG